MAGDGSDRRTAALFVDFENVFRGLRDASPEAARRFATDPGRWAKWIEQDLGPLYVDDVEGPRVLLRRICYLDPAASSRYRAYFTRAGFRVVDCPSLTAMGKNSADIHMVLDILDTLTHPTRYDEFLVLSADADFTPVLLRLREHDRRTAMLVIGPTAAALQASCDFAIPDTIFIEEALELGAEGDDTLLAAAPAPAARPAPIADGHEQLRTRIAGAIRDLVEKADAPVNMGMAAHAVRSAVGPQVKATDWAGLGGFKQFVATIEGEHLVLDPTHPGWLLDPTRHERVMPGRSTSGDIPEVAERVSRVVGAPLLGRRTYAALFASIADIGRQGVERSPAEDERAIRNACAARDHPIARQAVHFVLVGLRYSRVPWQRPDVNATDLATKFADNVLRLAANAQLELTEDERRDIQHWIAGIGPLDGRADDDGGAPVAAESGLR